MKINWLNRRISAPGPYLCLCLTEKEFLAALKHLKCRNTTQWISSPQAHATTHHVSNSETLGAIVCINDWKGRDPIEIAGLLVHEAVHVWQGWCEYYGETHPGREQEAYAIQAIAQELLAEFARRVKEETT